jgi:hypothetical protein
VKEAVFVTEVIRSLRHFGFWAFKIPDAPITKELLKITRFTMAKPCDIVACLPSGLDGLFVAIECKQFKKWKSFSLRDMRPAQVEQLSAIEDHGGSCWVFLNVRVGRDNRLIIFEWAELRHRFLKKKESIKAKELQERKSVKVLKIGDKIGYDLSGMKGAV